ncbi:hypothetical protein INR49_017164 [Caranx melampygus]|nr:hypothetical protein INR49_017164 [Caranx melampygus]
MQAVVAPLRRMFGKPALAPVLTSALTSASVRRPPCALGKLTLTLNLYTKQQKTHIRRRRACFLLDSSFLLLLLWLI